MAEDTPESVWNTAYMACLILGGRAGLDPPDKAVGIAVDLATEVFIEVKRRRNAYFAAQQKDAAD